MAQPTRKKIDCFDELSLTLGRRRTTISILSKLLFEVQGSRPTITTTGLGLTSRLAC